MKVYFIGSKYHGCNYLRMLLPMFHNGWNGSIISVGAKEKPIRYILPEVMDADIVVFHRADTVEHHKLGQILKGMGKKVVFDNDDTYKLSEKHPFHMLDENGFEQNKTFKNNLIDNFILNSDLVTCTTESLAKEYREINPNVVVLPNCVDEFDWDEPLRNEGDKIRIGIVGSTAYNFDFEHVQEFITKLNDRKDVQLVLFGLHGIERQKKNRLIQRVYRKEFAFWNNLKGLEHVEWCEMKDYFRTLNNLKLDIMLIPRIDKPFNKAKSNVKFLEAAMCEVPCIAQGFSTNDSPYDQDLNGKNGILIKDNSKWMEETVKLIEDKELRRNMGKEAKKYVLENYNIEDKAHLWRDAYNKLKK
jgi:glycosyltransferase involved in cell wall biosynthesis